MKKYSFFKEETFGLRHQITFVGDKLEIYLPKYYLEEDSSFGTVLGDKIETLGLFWFKVNNKFYKLLYPLKFQFEYHEESTFKGKLSPELPVNDYNVFILKNGDAFCYDKNHIKDISDIELMLNNIIDQGKLPNIINYNDALTVYLNLLTASGYGTKLGVSSAVVEILLSELYRNKHNPAEPFRKLLNSSNSVSLYDFKIVKLTNLTGMNSIFNSLLGEDVYKQLSNIVVRHREKKPDRESPLEKLLKY